MPVKITPNVLPVGDVAYNAFPSGKIKDMRQSANRLLGAVLSVVTFS